MLIFQEDSALHWEFFTVYCSMYLIWCLYVVIILHYIIHAHYNIKMDSKKWIDIMQKAHHI